MEDSAQDLFQIAQLIDQLRHDDNALRVNAAKNVQKIAIALGPERTRDELVPFIGESIDDEDEVVLVYAEQLGELIDCVGGHQYCYKILQTLGGLCVAEETSVREMTCRSIAKVIEVISEEDIEKYFVPLVLELAGKEWYTSRMSACCLMHVAYAKLKTNRKQTFKDLFIRLCADPTPLVRKTSATNFGLFCKAIMHCEHRIPVEFLKSFTMLSTDDQDSVRIQNIDNCAVLCELLSVEAKLAQVVPVVVKLADDKAWRVRWCLTHKLSEIGKMALSLPTTEIITTGQSKCISVEPENYTNIQITIVNFMENVVENLLNDAESEVRSAAAANVHQYCRLFRKDRIIDVIVPCLQKLVNDNSSEYVKTSIALSINEISVVLGKEATVEYLLPMLLVLLRDPAAPVRLNIISNLYILNNVIGVELLSQSLLPAIIELSTDAKWRVRFAIIELMPMLINQLGLEFFNDQLCELTLNWLCDRVYTIRRAASENLSALAKKFGEEWTIKHVIPKLKALQKQSNYLHRVIGVYALSTLSECFSTNKILTVLMPIVLEAASDPVANVRFTAIKVLAEQYKLLNKSAPTNNNITQGCNQIVELITNLHTTDVDRDVLHISNQVLLHMDKK